MASTTDWIEISQFRASRTTRSGPARGQTDNDTLDGLPIRQWRKVESIVGAGDAPSNVGDAPRRGEGIWKELPMPEGSSNYPIWSQQILRAARAGRVLQSQDLIRKMYKMGKEDDRVMEAEGNVGGDEVQRGIKRSLQDFQVRRWAQLSRQQEESGPQYLAKRRDGLPSVHRIPPVDSSSSRHTRVRRVNAQNQPVIYEVLVAEGKTLEGEVTQEFPGDVELVVKPAPGTMIEGLGISNENGIIVVAEATVPLFGRGRPPPPRRKPKRGPGRGRRKIDFTPIPNSIDTGGEGAATVRRSDVDGGDMTMGNAEDETAGTTPAVGEDDGDEGEEDEDEDAEDGDGDLDAEADGDNDDDREEGELTPSPEPETQKEASEVLKRFQNPVRQQQQAQPQQQQHLPPPPPSLPKKPPPVSGGYSPIEQRRDEPASQHSRSQTTPLPGLSIVAPPPPRSQPLVPSTEPFRIPGLSMSGPPVSQDLLSEARPVADASPGDTEMDVLGSLERHLQEEEEGEVL